MTLFVYGELCKPAVVLEVLGRMPPAEAALAVGFRRRLNPGTGFYQAVRDAEGLLPGLLLEGLDARELTVLDRFENVAGGEYQRIETRTRRLSTGVEEIAWIYAAG